MPIHFLDPNDPRYPKDIAARPDRTAMQREEHRARIDTTDTFHKEVVTVHVGKAPHEVVLWLPEHRIHAFCRPLDNRELFTSMRPEDWDKLGDAALEVYATLNGCAVEDGPHGEPTLQRSRMVQIRWPVDGDAL